MSSPLSWIHVTPMTEMNVRIRLKGSDVMKALVLFLCALTVASAAFADDRPPIPATPAAVDDILYIRPFTLEAGYTFNWCKERPVVTSGTLLVLKVSKDLVIPRQEPQPVLYVGSQTAQRINHGDESGHVIAIVPGEVDLTTALIWFGAPDLPERVDETKIATEHARAEKAGIKPFSEETINRAADKGSERLNVGDFGALLRGQVAELVLEYSPQEKRLADAFRVPVVKREPKPSGE